MAQAGDGAELTEGDQESRDGAAEGSTGASTGQGRVGKPKAFAASAQWPNKSTGPMRADVLEVLGVLKVATPLQIQRLTRPDAASDRYIRATLRDLELHQLVVCEGRANGEKSTTGSGNAGRGLWLLRGKAGLQAAGAVLEDSREMGGTASGAGKSGGGHALAVNESIISFIRGGTAPGSPAGMSAIGDWSTEAAHPLQGNRKVIPDALLRAPMRDVSVLMLELDRYGMEASRLAAKCANYRELFRRQVRNDHPAAGTGTIPKTVPMWKQMYPGHRREGYPPLAIVFTGRADRPVSEQALLNRLETIGEATREYWAPVRRREHSYDHDTWLDYQDAIPIIATTLSLLQQHGPLGPVWIRYGREEDGFQPLTRAILNTETRGMYDARRKAERDRAAEKRRSWDEARRCPTCDKLPNDVKYGTGHEPGEECDRCADKRRKREQKERGWDGWGEDPAVAQARAAQQAEEAARLEAEEEEFQRLQEEDSLRGLARALFRRTPKREDH
jgi:hypothetical protein